MYVNGKLVNRVPYGTISGGKNYVKCFTCGKRLFEGELEIHNEVGKFMTNPPSFKKIPCSGIFVRDPIMDIKF
jgi:hypothetical protein